MSGEPGNTNAQGERPAIPNRRPSEGPDKTQVEGAAIP